MFSVWCPGDAESEEVFRDEFWDSVPQNQPLSVSLQPSLKWWSPWGGPTPALEVLPVAGCRASSPRGAWGPACAARPSPKLLLHASFCCSQGALFVLCGKKDWPKINGIFFRSLLSLKKGTWIFIFFFKLWLYTDTSLLHKKLIIVLHKELSPTHWTCLYVPAVSFTSSFPH